MTLAEAQQLEGKQVRLTYLLDGARTVLKPVEGVLHQVTLSRFGYIHACLMDARNYRMPISLGVEAGEEFYRIEVISE